MLSAIAEAKPQDKFKVGFTLTLSGSGARWANAAQQGIELALEDLKASKSSREIEVIYEDIGTIDLKKAASAAQKMINIDKVDVICPFFTEDAEVIWPIAASKNVVTLSLRAGGDGLTHKSPLLFRVSASDRLLVKAGVNYAAKQGYKKGSVIAAQSAYFSSMKDMFIEEWQKATGTLPFIQEFPYGNKPDFRSLLMKAKDKGVLFTFTDLQGLLLKQRRDLNLDIPVIGFYIDEDPSVKLVASEAIEGVVFPKHVPAIKSFKKRFIERYGEKPGEPADYAYDTIMILAKVINEFGTDTDDIIEGLHSLRDYPGASGLISIDSTGSRISKEIELWKYTKGSPIRIFKDQQLLD